MNGRVLASFVLFFQTLNAGVAYLAWAATQLPPRKESAPEISQRLGLIFSAAFWASLLAAYSVILLLRSSKGGGIPGWLSTRQGGLCFASAMLVLSIDDLGRTVIDAVIMRHLTEPPVMPITTRSVIILICIYWIGTCLTNERRRPRQEQPSTD